MNEVSRQRKLAEWLAKQVSCKLFGIVSRCFPCIFCFTDFLALFHANSLLGGVRAEMFLQESTGQGREIATREEPPNVGSINSSSNLCREL